MCFIDTTDSVSVHFYDKGKTPLCLINFKYFVSMSRVGLAFCTAVHYFSYLTSSLSSVKKKHQTEKNMKIEQKGKN